jgi:type III secretion protein Q
MSRGVAWVSQWCDKCWQVRISGPVNIEDSRPGVVLALKIREAPAYLALSRMAAEALLAEECGPVMWGDLPDEIVLAIVQSASDALIDRSRLAGNSGIRITAWGEAGQAMEMPFAFRVSIANEVHGQQIDCYLLTGHDGANELANLGESVPDTAYLLEWAALPVLVGLELGWVNLSFDDLASLAPEDVLIPDGWWGEPGESELCLRIGPSLGIRARLNKEGHVCAESKVTRMEQETVDGAFGDESSGLEMDAPDLGQVPVRITFDLGERQISLAELAGVAAGHVFDLGLAPERAVNLRINGMRIGEGELVEIDGRIGVLVTRIAAPK